MKKYSFIYLILLGCSILSCDNYYSVEIVNLTKDSITIETDIPDIVGSKDEQLSRDYNNILNINQMVHLDTIGNKLIAKLGPDNIFYLYRRGGGSFHMEKMCFSTLAIYTQNDTIIASDKKAIFDMTDKQEFKYDKSIDNDKAFKNSSTTRYILILDKK